jgi:hypothetical protein
MLPQNTRSHGNEIHAAQRRRVRWSIVPHQFSTKRPGDVSWAGVYLGIGLTTLATLLLELSLTRIFQSFFIIILHSWRSPLRCSDSAPAACSRTSWPAARRQRFRNSGRWRRNGIVIVLSLTFVMTRTGEPGNGTLALVYFASALPFFFAGAIISLAISETIQRVDRVYFYDLIGASAGCLAVIPLLNVFGGPNTVIVAALVFAVSAAIWYNIARQAAARVAAVSSRWLSWDSCS